MLLAHGIFLALLLINTVFSVRFFMPLLPRTAAQWVLDALLVLLYLSLFISLGKPLLFPFCATLLFVLATMKYAVALGHAPLPVLRKKIIIDLLGGLLCFGALALAALGYQLEASYLLAGIFCAANVYLLLINPMYAHEKAS